MNMEKENYMIRYYMMYNVVDINIILKNKV